jgi:predicted TPR repeat methyltransferase
MAAEFDEHLVDKLGYRIPDRLAEVLGSWLDTRARPRRVLDLGCGTGLVADALRGRFEEIRGVDLSPNMVALARARKLYSDVQTGDLVAFLAGCPDAGADLLVAADVFIYVGDLAAFFAQARRVLAPGGRLAFSVEGGGRGDAFTLGATGRYSHADGYVRSLATANAFTVTQACAETLRAERGSPVGGRLYMLA